MKYPLVIAACMLMIASTGLAQKKEKKDKSDVDAKVKKIIDEIVVETKHMLRHDYEAYARLYEKRLNLGQETVAKLKSVASEYAKKAADGIKREQIEGILRDLVDVQRIEAFTINERLTTLVPNTKRQPAKITVSLGKQWIWLSAPRGGSTFSRTVLSEITQDKKWREALSNVSKDKMKKFHAQIEKERRSATLELMQNFLTDELLLTPKQVEPLKKWLEKIYRKNNDCHSAYEHAIYLLRNNATKPPAILSKVQLESYRLLQNRLKMR